MKTVRQNNKKLTIRRNDMVIVIAGKDKGKTGRVITVDSKKERLLIEGVNIVQRHTKPNAKNQQGGIVKNESPIHYSNVQLLNPSLNRGVRVRIKITEAGVKNRICVKTGEILG